MAQSHIGNMSGMCWQGVPLVRPDQSSTNRISCASISLVQFNSNTVMNNLPPSMSSRKPHVCRLSLILVLSFLCTTNGLEAADTTSLRKALTFLASFDHGLDADFGAGDRRLFHAPSLKHPRIGTVGLPANGAISIARGEGRTGDALRFHRAVPEVVFYQVEKNLTYSKSNWSGTVSFWLRLDPDTDLVPGYCDPLQITPRDWNDASFWVDFSKDERPRHFRLGMFADRSVWDPQKRNYDTLPANERPLVTVTRPPFSRNRWTHVAFTYENFNTGKKDGTATLYLDGKPQGTVSAWEQTLAWDLSKTIAMIGINYTGLFDELAFFDRALTATEVGQLFALPDGLSAVRQ